MYGEVKELFPDYAASPMWKYFKLTHYVDAKLSHD